MHLSDQRGVSMHILGICGSPKTDKSSTRFLLTKALEAAAELDVAGEVSTQLISVADFDIQHCSGCDSCVRKKPCPQSAKDDMPRIEKAMKEADAVIIAAPSYFSSIPGVLKDVIDRSRAMKMLDHQLRNKVFGAITYAGLQYGGQEHVVDALNRYALGQGMIVVGSVGSPVRDGNFGSGSLQTDEGSWRSAVHDELAIQGSLLLGRRVAEVTHIIKTAGGMI
jgi:multimeric flavodoxin WrbA